MPSSLTLKGIRKSFGQQQVLHDLSLDLRAGETFSLLGPSGCGKTTALRIIAGLESADAGEITFSGQRWLDARDRSSLPPQRRNIGMVFQNYAIWPHMTVLQHVMYPLRRAEMSQAERLSRARAVIELVGLEGHEHAPATRLSGGQQQRVAIARAIAKAPGLLLLDEPFSSLDVNLREQMRVEIARLQKQLGITMLIVTHDQLDAFALSNRIGVMSHGTLVQIADARTLYEQPTSSTVRDFIGQSINLDGTLAEIGEGRCVVELGDGTRLRLTHGPATALPAIGGKVTIWLRPEDVVVAGHDQDDDPLRPRIAGIVEQSVFVGDRYHCLVQLGWGPRIWTYLPRKAHPRPSQRIVLAIDLRGAHIELANATR